MGADALFRSSAFWLSLFAGAWLALDPIVKCTYVVVYQHLRSRREGDDLRGLLASLPREQQKKAEMIASTGAGRSVKIGAAVVAAAIFLGFRQATSARAAQAPPTQSIAETPTDSAQPANAFKNCAKLWIANPSARFIAGTMQSTRAPPTWLDKLLAKIGHAIQRAWNAFWNFIRRLWPRGLNLSPEREGRRVADEGSSTVAGVDRGFDLGRGSRALLAAAGAARRSFPSLSQRTRYPTWRHSVANERSEDEWFALADRLEGEGELRLALRAAYLGLLAGLAQREWLTIRRDRTNREYLDEFTRRWRRRPQAAVETRTEIPEKLRGSLRVFDLRLVWLSCADAGGGCRVPPGSAGAARAMSDNRAGEGIGAQLARTAAGRWNFRGCIRGAAAHGASESVEHQRYGIQLASGPLRHQLAV